MFIKKKTIHTLLFSVLMSIGASAQEGSFQLTVKPSKPMPEYKTFLFYKKGPGNIAVDSAGFKDGKFTLSGNTRSAQRAILYVEQANKGFGHGKNTKPGITVYLEKGDIMISLDDSLKNIKRSGTTINRDYQAYLDAAYPFTSKEAVLSKKYAIAVEKDNAVDKGDIELAFAKLKKERLKVEEKYFLGHLNSIVSLEWLKNSGYEKQEKTKATQLFAMLSEDLRNSPMGKAYSSTLRAAVSVEIGSEAPGFTAKDLQGNPVSLSAFRGKYVLLDFWASWCLPCRRENPNVLKAYEAYKAKNFTILAFSLDEKQSAWQNAVKQDGLPWTQVSDLAGWGSEVARLYGVSAIPANVLIDPQGKIIARDLRGESLPQALTKVL